MSNRSTTDEIIRIPAKKPSNTPFIILGVVFVVGLFALIWYAITRQTPPKDTSTKPDPTTAPVTTPNPDGTTTDPPPGTSPAPGTTPAPGTSPAPGTKPGPGKDWMWVPIDNATATAKSSSIVPGNVTLTPIRYNLTWVDDSYHSLKFVLTLPPGFPLGVLPVTIYEIIGLKAELSTTLKILNQEIIGSCGAGGCFYGFGGRLDLRLVYYTDSQGLSYPALKLLGGSPGQSPLFNSATITFIISGVRR